MNNSGPRNSFGARTSFKFVWIDLALALLINVAVILIAWWLV